MSKRIGMPLSSALVRLGLGLGVGNPNPNPNPNPTPTLTPTPSPTPNPTPNPNLELGEVAQAQRVLGGALVELVRRGPRRGGSAAGLQLGTPLHERAVAPVQRHVQLAALVALAHRVRAQAAHLARLRVRVRVRVRLRVRVRVLG